MSVWVVLALGVLLPATAFAQTRYVAKGGTDTPDCTNAAAPCGTIVYAVGQASAGDTIQIGPGTFEESVTTDKALTFVGAGGGSLGGNLPSTVVRGPVGNNGDGFPAFDLSSGGELRSLRAVGGDGDSSIAFSGETGGAGIAYVSSGVEPTALRLEDVVAIGGNGGAGSSIPGGAGFGLHVRSDSGEAALTSVGSDFAAGSGFGGGGAIWVDGPEVSAAVTDSLVENSLGTAIVVFSGAHLDLEAVDDRGADQAAWIYDGLLTIRRSRLSSEGSVLVAAGTNDESPQIDLVDSLVVSEKGEALDVYSEEEGSAAVAVRGSTLIGRGIAGAVLAERKEGAGPATTTLRNSIARHLPLAEIIPATDLHADGGTIDADFSSFTTRLEENGGSVSAPGSAHNVAGDPGFLDPGQGVFILQNTSPLIDRGDPAIVAAGELDLAGSPRSLDGNRDCLAFPDLGAFEVTGQAVPCPNQQQPAVAAPPAGSGPDSKVPDSPPSLSDFDITNRVFAPAKVARTARVSGAETSAHQVKRGTQFTYTLSEPARVEVAISRQAQGRRVGKGGKAQCATVTAANRSHRHCIRLVKITVLGDQEQAGPQSTPWNGLVRGKPAKPGRYRAVAVAVDAAGQRSQPRQLDFRIVAP
jgi:hypothetical protein